jgi:hypothetical protein
MEVAGAIPVLGSTPVPPAPNLAQSVDGSGSTDRGARLGRDGTSLLQQEARAEEPTLNEDITAGWRRRL